MTAMRVFPFRFRQARVTKAQTEPDRHYTPGETVLWPGDVQMPDWLEVIAILSDDPRSVPVRSVANI